MEKKKDIIKCYYRSSDLNQYQNLQETLLFDSLLFNNVIGRGFYIVSLFKTFPVDANLQFDIEQGVFYLDDTIDQLKKNCVYFTISAFNSSVDNRFKPLIDLTYQITGGSGKYLGASGTINFVTDVNATRFVTLTIIY
jgi:hypothetical protein